jgi:cysteine desulfurase
MSTRTKNRIYLDHAALTPTRKEVLAEIKKYSGPEYANPSSIHAEGVAARDALKDARKRTAAFFHASPEEIIFTASGTEANNIALFGVAHVAVSAGKSWKDLHIITSAIEHPSISEPLKEIARRGARVDYISVDVEGVVDLEQLKKQLSKDTILVSIQTVNNEIGTVQPISEIAKIIRHFKKSLQGSTLSTRSNLVERGPIFHTDASQAALYYELHQEKIGADLITIDAHKINGPRGVGVLFKRRNLELAPLIFGGGQEYGVRSATENLPAILGMALALEIAEKSREREGKRLEALRDYFISELMKLPSVTFNGSRAHGAPHIVNISLGGRDNEFFVIQLSEKGISASTKSSCLKESDESYVIKALGKSARDSVRFSFGRDTTGEDLKKTISLIKSILS